MSAGSERDAGAAKARPTPNATTNAKIGPTDVGIVEFRKLIMGAARALGSGEAPKAPAAASRYAVRAGGWIAGPDKDFATVMTERFGHRHGYVGGEHGLAD